MNAENLRKVKAVIMEEPRDAIERYIACDGDWRRDDMRRISTDDKEAEAEDGQ